MAGPHWLRTFSPSEILLALLMDPGRRISVLLVVGYVSGLAGILLSFWGNPSDPESVYGVAGIVLMGTSFLCLFVLSVTMMNLDDG